MILKVVHKLSRVPFTLFREPPYGIRVISRIPRGEIRGLLGTTRVFSFADSVGKKKRIRVCSVPRRAERNLF